jgi:tRNA dimethylallyltransferase
VAPGAAVRKLPVVAILGSTCTGKTSLSIALAKSLGSEIIACDSRTVYRYMDIGTAKPTPEERREVPHHLLDVVDPNQSYSTAEYRRAATPVIEKLIENKRIPIVCGGTGFYFKNLLEGLEIPPIPPQPELRSKLKALADEQGNQALHAKLFELDPTSATRINVNDRFRLVRALEVCICMGRPFSAVAALAPPMFSVIWIGLQCTDRNLHMRMIRDRLNAQFERGLLEEVSHLYRKYGKCHSLLHTVGYAEFLPFLTGGEDSANRGEKAKKTAERSIDETIAASEESKREKGNIDLAQARELCATHTFQLARKQMIWFRRNKKINWFAVDEEPMEKIVQDTLTLIRSNLA